jgi:HSP20 family protein
MRALTPLFWRSGGPFESFRQELEDYTKRFFGAPLAEVAQHAFAPSVDVAETDKEVTVKADLPGVDPKDVEISVLDGSLVLRGQKKEEREEKGKNFWRAERFEGEFYRELPLPAGVDEEKISATCTKGVVTITIPKKPAAQAKKIAVKPQE